MAKQGNKVLPARRPRGEESLLIRSAESLGKVIGRLQRQLDRSAATESSNTRSKPDGLGATKPRRTKGDTNKAQSAAPRRSKRAAKSAANKKAPDHSRTPSRRKTTGRTSRRG
jgi:hypothetical protein